MLNCKYCNICPLRCEALISNTTIFDIMMYVSYNQHVTSRVILDTNWYKNLKLVVLVT